MHQIVCDKCQRTEKVEWTQIFVGWLLGGRALQVRPGHVIPVDKRKGEYLETLGHGILPVPDDWQYIYSQNDFGDETPPPFRHLCPDCRTTDVQDD